MTVTLLAELSTTAPPAPFSAAGVDRAGLQDRADAVALFCVTATLPAAPSAPVPIALPVRAFKAPVVRSPVVRGNVREVIVPALPPAGVAGAGRCPPARRQSGSPRMLPPVDMTFTFACVRHRLGRPRYRADPFAVRVVVVAFPALARVTVPALRPTVSALAARLTSSRSERRRSGRRGDGDVAADAVSQSGVLNAPELTVVPDSVMIQLSRRLLYRLRRRFWRSSPPVVSRYRCR